MAILDRVSNFLDYARDILSPDTENPRLMSTLTYACRAESGTLRYEWQTTKRDGGRREQKRVPIAVPITVYRHAEAQRVQTPNGFMYTINWVTTDVISKDYYQVWQNNKKQQTRIYPLTFKDGRSSSLLTREEAVSLLREVEKVLYETKEEYFGQVERSYRASSNHQTPDSHFSLWESREPAQPQAQPQTNSQARVSP